MCSTFAASVVPVAHAADASVMSGTGVSGGSEAAVTGTVVETAAPQTAVPLVAAVAVNGVDTTFWLWALLVLAMVGVVGVLGYRYYYPAAQKIENY